LYFLEQSAMVFWPAGKDTDTGCAIK